MKTKEYMNLLKNGRVKEAEKLRQSTNPVKLIKFIWLDGSETDEKKFETLKRDEIWFSNKSFLNDPYEFKGMIIDRDKLQTNGYPDAIINMFEKMLSSKKQTAEYSRNSKTNRWGCIYCCWIF